MHTNHIDHEPMMRAVTHERYGSARKLSIKDTVRPACGPDEVLVDVRSVSVNPYDWHNMTGTPLPVRLSGGLTRPKASRLGVDVAGVVENVGKNVTRFKAGDKVFGFADGCFAEYVCAKQSELVNIPDTLSFDEAAAVPVAALTALQGLVNNADVKANQHVLINGASGGVGTFAVQIAKTLGAEVTGVCGPSNVDMVKSLGADHVIDYSKTDFTRNRSTYDVILDNVGNKRMSQHKKCLKPTGRYVVVGGQKGFFLGAISNMLKALISFKFSKHKAHVFMASRALEDIERYTEMLASGAIKPVIDRVYSFNEIREQLFILKRGERVARLL